MAVMGGLLGRPPIINENGPGDPGWNPALGGPGAGLLRSAPSPAPSPAPVTPTGLKPPAPQVHTLTSGSPGLAPPTTNDPARPVGSATGGLAPSGTPSTPSPSTSAPASASAPGLTSPNGQQTVPSVGLPTGYNLGAGVPTSATSFMPTGISSDTFQSIPLPTATAPSAQTYITSLQGQVQGPTNWNVTPNQTVQGQYAALMKTGNPAIQAAEQQVIRQYAQSGGNNSLMAQTAAATAGSQVALSIASQDAQTNAAAGQYNATVANNFATAMNGYVANMTASQQAFDQGVAQLTNQSNANMRQLYGQVVQGAASASEAVQENLANAQTNINATMEQMDKTFAQSVQTAQMQNQFANENAWTNYGMQVRAAYLANVNQQQTALMQTIGAINANPNISAAQAQAGVQSAVDQFNAFMTLSNSYYTSMVPGNSVATYMPYNPDGYPNN